MTKKQRLLIKASEEIDSAIEWMCWVSLFNRWDEQELERQYKLWGIV